MTTLGQYAAGIMQHLCDHANHGYTQGNRWGDGGRETIQVYDRAFTIATGDRDCSSAVISCWNAVLEQCKGITINATYTGNMRSGFLATGLFERWNTSSTTAISGDVYLNEGCHTAMCITPDPDLLGEFSISEDGTIYGNVGDQTGREAYVHAYYDYPWDMTLHCTDQGNYSTNAGNTTTQPTQTTHPTGEIVPCHYALRSLNGEWLPEVTNFNNSDDQGYAGNPCCEHDYFYVYADRGSVKYRVHVVEGYWLDWVDHADKTDLVNGCAGIDGVAIDAVEIYYYTPDGEEYKQAWYRSQTTQREGWLPVVCDDGTSNSAYTDEYAGNFGEPLDRLQVCISDSNPF